MIDRKLAFGSAQFEAARHVDILPDGHPSRRLHGHSFVASIWANRSAIPSTFSGTEADDLRNALESCVAPLDYSLLNDHIEIPTDENLARWIRQQVGISEVEMVGVQSTTRQGVKLDASGCAHIWRRFRFEAAHQLPNVRRGHKCGRMHGHGFEVILHVSQDVTEADMGVDFDYLEECWKPIEMQLHHSCLNDVAGLENPTSEMIATWIWDRVIPSLPKFSWVTVFETKTAGCHYRPDEYRIWKDLDFDAAVRFSNAPETDPRHYLHGHSYVTSLHLKAPLDEVMGWDSRLW